MNQHLWAGVITGASIFFTIGLFFIYHHNQRFYYAYFASLVLSNVAIGYTSHMGGSITHGQDYLTEYVPVILNGFESKEKPESEMLVYDDVIAPVLEAKCISCHNQTKTKGDLLLTSYENLFKEGKSEKPSITSHDPDKSELYNRVVLPRKHDDHMPPEGKTPLNENEIKMLKYWIESGASDQSKVSEVKADKKMGGTMNELLKDLVRYKRKAGISKMKKKVLQKELDELAKKLSIIIIADSTAEENHFAISMKFPPEKFTNNQLLELVPYYDVFSKVSLVSADIDDDALYFISQMPNLKELYLQKTMLDGSGLIYLQAMKNLEVLNLSYTRTDDKAAIDLLKIPNLKKVYLFQTQTSRQVVEALHKNKPRLEILLEEGPYF